MKCTQCFKKSEFVCPCNNLLFCFDHVGAHMILPGKHVPERHSISISTLDFQAVKKEIAIRLQQINKSEKKIKLQVKELIIQLEESSKAALKELSSLSQSYYLLLSLESLSGSLKAMSEKVLSTNLKLKDFDINISATINDAFTKGLVSYVDKPQQKRLKLENKPIEEKKKKELNDKKNAEEKKKAEEITSKPKEELKKRADLGERGNKRGVKFCPQQDKSSVSPDKGIVQEAKPTEKIEHIEQILENNELVDSSCNEIEQNEIVSKPSQMGLEEVQVDYSEEYRNAEIKRIKDIEKNEENSIISFLKNAFSSKLLDEKKKLMELFNIDKYQKWFSNDGEYKCSISEIKLSNDGLFSFICNHKIGK